MPRKEERKFFLGKTCPKCKAKNVIFTGVEKSATHLLPVRGEFRYPCRSCDWTLYCSVNKLEEYDEAEVTIPIAEEA